MGYFERAYLWGRGIHIRTRRRLRGDREYALLPMLVKPRMAAIDVGANRGVYTFPLAARATHVFAYEPSPWLARYLGAGVPANVTVRNVAVSDTPGTVTLRVPKRTDGKLAHNQGSIDRYSEAGTVSAEVEAVRLDDEKLPPIGFIKIDTEDHELPVIRGAAALIARDRPNLLVEVLDFHANPRWPALAEQMHDLGYEAYVLHHGALCHAREAERHAPAESGINVLFLPRAEAVCRHA